MPYHSVATSGGGTWSKISDEFYIRDVSGKELAIYNSNHTIEQWNLYGSDNVGKIDANNHRFFYLKDHLGTVRAVLDTTNTVIAANDYDAWGYPLVDRSYDASITTQKYKFTGKERDNENNYDYFGARYYDSRIGRWGGVEPLLTKFGSWSPYQYGLCNPLFFLDFNGNDVDVSNLQKEDNFLQGIGFRTNFVGDMVNSLEKISGLGLEVVGGKLKIKDSKVMGGSNIARKLLRGIIEANATLIVNPTNRNGSFTMPNSMAINLAPAQIYSFINGAKNGLNPETQGWGMTFLHELQHTAWSEDIKNNGPDPKTGIGPIEGLMNQVRAELGSDYGYRAQYGYDEFGGFKYLPFSIATKEEINKQNEPSNGYYIKYNFFL